VGVAPNGARGFLAEELGQYRPHLAPQLVAVQRAAEGELADPPQLAIECLADRLLDRSLEQRRVLMFDRGP
jgi:hypothetical protein